MLWIVTLALLVLIYAKPSHAPLGVQTKEKGKMRIGVDGASLHITCEGDCRNTFIIWYPVTKLFERDGYCCCFGFPGGSFRFKSSCPLKFNPDGLIDIDVEEAPKGYSVTITNAYLAPKKNSKNDNFSSVFYVIILALIGVLAFFLVRGVVAWFCFRPRWIRARAARNAAVVQKNAVGAEVEEEAAVAPALVSVPSNTAISSVPVSSDANPVATAPLPPVSSTAPSTVPSAASANLVPSPASALKQQRPADSLSICCS